MSKLVTSIAAVLLCASAQAAAPATQDSLKPIVNSGENVLQFDWPMLRIGTGEYAEGPTGVTVFSFGRKVLGAVDVRGGGPGTVNTDFLRLGYNAPDLDAVVFAGGSWYGLEATTAVASAMKDDGLRDGDWFNLALSVGAIIYDLGDRRLNEIYPDKRLAQAAYRASQPGVFPLGAHGAGRLARSGGYFGCNAHSGQGGAFRQIGDVKIATFTVVNALGVITDREGRVVACYPDAKWPQPLRADHLMSGTPASRKAGWSPTTTDDKRRNTTVSLVVVNQKLDPAELQRLAVQVHTSMSRGLQPFATEFDGDVLYAVSTAEVEPTKDKPLLAAVDIGTIASELMWDAILASVPQQPALSQATRKLTLKAEQLERFVGDYTFSDLASVRITQENGKLYAQATGKRKAFAIPLEQRIELLAVSNNEFTATSRYPFLLRFEGQRMVINPGHWEQVADRR